MVRKIQVEHVEEYLWCPLFYRYRRELKLPFNENTDDIILLKSMKKAIASWFHALGKGLDRKKARAKVGRALKRLWSKDGGTNEGFPLAHARITSVLLTLDNQFNQKTDTPIDGGLSIGSSIDGTLFEDIIDGLYLRNDLKPGAKRKDKILITIQVVLRKRSTSPRVVQMRKAMIRYAYNSAMKPNPYPIKLLQIVLPEGTHTWHDLDKHAYDEFIFLGRSIVRHLDANHYMPTGNASKCKECPFKEICSNHFCEPTVSRQLVDRARTKLLHQ